MAVSLATALRTNRAQAIVDYAGASAQIKLYTAAYGTLLGTLTCGATLGTVASGVITFGAVTSDTAADASGTVALARIYKSDGVTLVMEGLTVGTAATNIIVNTDVVTVGGTIVFVSGTITEGNV